MHWMPLLVVLKTSGSLFGRDFDLMPTERHFSALSHYNLQNGILSNSHHIKLHARGKKVAQLHHKLERERETWEYWGHLWLQWSCCYWFV